VRPDHSVSNQERYLQKERQARPMVYDADILYQQVRKIRARRLNGQDGRTTKQVEQDYFKDCLYNSIIRCGPECGPKRNSHGRSHYGKAWKGLAGHRYPSTSNRPQVVKNAAGKNVVVA
jgi:hypothetical protein